MNNVTLPGFRLGASAPSAPRRRAFATLNRRVADLLSSTAVSSRHPSRKGHRVTQRPIDDFAADEHADPAVVDSLPRAVVVTSRENRIVRWNRAANEVFGWTED